MLILAATLLTATVVAVAVAMWTRALRRRVAEQTAELRESQELYETIFRVTGTSMISFGEDEVIRLANEEWASLTGWSASEVVGTKTPSGSG
jgi:PAS domain-containing protein